MTTGLEVAPPAEVVEHVPEDLDIPDMVGHIYRLGSSVTWCGISANEDAHFHMHRREPCPSLAEIVWDGSPNCPLCGAPLCKVCEENAPNYSAFAAELFKKFLKGEKA